MPKGNQTQSVDVSLSEGDRNLVDERLADVENPGTRRSERLADGRDEDRLRECDKTGLLGELAVRKHLAEETVGFTPVDGKPFDAILSTGGVRVTVDVKSRGKWAWPPVPDMQVRDYTASEPADIYIYTILNGPDVDHVDSATVAGWCWSFEVSTLGTRKSKGSSKYFEVSPVELRPMHLLVPTIRAGVPRAAS